jgi:hypothetical protein
VTGGGFAEGQNNPEEFVPEKTVGAFGTGQEDPEEFPEDVKLGSFARGQQAESHIIEGTFGKVEGEDEGEGEGEGNAFQFVAAKPLTCASYIGGPVTEAFVEPVGVGEALPTVALFLTPDEYVPVPLETTYLAAFEAVPDFWREALEQG